MLVITIRGSSLYGSFMSTYQLYVSNAFSLLISPNDLAIMGLGAYGPPKNCAVKCEILPSRRLTQLKSEKSLLIVIFMAHSLLVPKSPFQIAKLTWPDILCLYKAT